MVPYRINPYVHFIENRLIPGIIQYGVFHQCTGDVIEPREQVRSLLLAAKLGNRISFSEEDLENPGEESAQIRQLIEKEFLIPEDYDPLSSFTEQYVVRPKQNPAVAYASDTGETLLVRMSMRDYEFSPINHELPEIIEERMPPIAAEVFRMADGGKKLGEIFDGLRIGARANILAVADFREAIGFLTTPERQLIKFTANREDQTNPYLPVNTVPRSLYHSARWESPSADVSAEPIIDFHLRGIDDAPTEFDLVEATVNHAFRFSSEALGGLDYGTRFCLSTLRPEVLPLLRASKRLAVLEVGGGSGAFARSFIRQARRLNGIDLDYHILDLSPALIRSQKKLLSELVPPITHIQQDATELDLSDRRFDLIIANEVIADFPVATVQKNFGAEIGSGAEANARWQGDGAYYLEKYNLANEAAPDFFAVNTGAFQFVERSWDYLTPGGALIVTEYGAADRYPTQSFHLNHEEFSIHFGHLKRCAEEVGFECRLLSLKDFLEIDDEVLILDGRQEQIMCLNFALKKYGVVIPFAALSEKELNERAAGIPERIGMVGLSFSPLLNGFHFGPMIEDFMVLLMNKPE